MQIGKIKIQINGKPTTIQLYYISFEINFFLLRHNYFVKIMEEAMHVAFLKI